MLRKGPVPLFVHGVIGYAVGVLLVAAPFLLGFESGAATAIAIVAGVLAIAHEASTEAPTGIARVVPVKTHVVIDLALAALLIASPFLFGFSDERNATAFFIVVGIFGILLTIATRFADRSDATAGATPPT